MKTALKIIQGKHLQFLRLLEKGWSQVTFISEWQGQNNLSCTSYQHNWCKWTFCWSCIWLRACLIYLTYCTVSEQTWFCLLSIQLKLRSRQEHLSNSLDERWSARIINDHPKLPLFSQVVTHHIFQLFDHTKRYNLMRNSIWKFFFLLNMVLFLDPLRGSLKGSNIHSAV